MLELKTLGRRELRSTGSARTRGHDPASLLRQPKPFALFAYLAVGARDLCRRDSLLALFWPELDETRARNALSQTLRRIRSAVGGDVVRMVGSQEVGIEAGAVRVDLTEFEDAASDGRLDVALDLYAGQFLPGFHLAGADGFERWLDEVRARSMRRAVRVASDLAARLESRREFASAVAILERVSRWGPTDETITRRLMTVLAHVGDNARALEEYSRLERALKAELDTTVSPETHALAQRIRRRQRVQGEDREDSVIRSVAVLPFANLMGDPEQEYFVDGMTDAVITALARSTTTRVISRQSVLLFKGSTRPMGEIARELGVDALMEGSVTRGDDRVRITVQLVRADPEEHLWADAFERELRDIVSLHADIATRIAASIGDTAVLDGKHPPSDVATNGETGQPPASTTIVPAAYEAYLKGRHFSLRLPDVEKAIGFFNASIEHDSRYAPAWAGLGAAYATLVMFAYVSPADGFPPLRRAARRALELDPALGEAHALLGIHRMLADRDWPGAEVDLDRGVRHATTSPEVHTYRAIFLGAMGRFEEAFSEARCGIALDPLSPSARFTLPWCQYKAGLHHEAIRELQTILELHPHFALAFPHLALNHALLGETDSAIAAVRRGLQLLPEDHEMLALGAAALGRCGATEEAVRAISRLLAIAERRYLDPWAVGIAYVGLGKEDEAMQWFQRMYDERSPSAFCVKEDPLLDSLRSLPKFHGVVQRLAFPHS
jgi:TolB-like protein